MFHYLSCLNCYSITLQIHGVFDRTIPESNTVMNVSSGRSYPWDIFVTIAEEGVTSQDVGRKICSCFAEFAK